jgi:antitoxin HicB
MTILGRESQVVELDEWNKSKVPGLLYECRVWVCPEPEGGYSAVVPSLPGVVTQGETLDETLENVKEAFRGVVAEYTESKESIPWRHEIASQKPRDTIEKWILVNV